MAWTGATAPLFHPLIFMKRFNETFCNFTHMTAILLHHRCTAWWNIFVFQSWMYSIQDFPILLEYDKFLIIRLTNNINLFLTPDIPQSVHFQEAMWHNDKHFSTQYYHQTLIFAPNIILNSITIADTAVIFWSAQVPTLCIPSRPLFKVNVKDTWHMWARECLHNFSWQAWREWNN